MSERVDCDQGALTPHFSNRGHGQMASEEGSQEENIREGVRTLEMLSSESPGGR